MVKPSADLLSVWNVRNNITIHKKYWQTMKCKTQRYFKFTFDKQDNVYDD